MTKYLFIAEKPSLMRDVEKVYKKYKSEIDNYIQGEIFFIALAGHICGYAAPDKYPQWNKKWYQLMEDLPMIPNPWQIVINPKTHELFRDVTQVYRHHSCNGLIVGTDSDVEGNGIFYLLEQKAGWENVPALRFFLDDQTEKGIKKAFLSMQNHRTNPRDVHMTESYLLRSKYDWLLGMNMTVGVTVQQGDLMKIGSVKGPTQKLVYDNCKAIDEFVPTTSYIIKSDFEPGFTGSLVNESGDVVEFLKREEAENEKKTFVSDTGVVKNSETNVVKTNAPKLYNLSDLQVDAGAKYGYTPDKTLKLVQSLYETHKVMSYPRTDGKYISTEKVEELPDVINALKTVPELNAIAGSLSKSTILGIKSKKNYVNDAEVLKASHDALLPTHIAPNFDKMSQDETNIYLMVSKRLLSIFLPPMEEYKSQIIIEVDGRDFKCTGSALKEEGWTALVPKKKKSDSNLPPLKKGDKVKIKEIYIHDKVTTPPKRFTESTLLEAMVNIASKLTDKEQKDIMKEVKGLGTQASRATIIRELKEAGYFTVQKGGIYITDLGKKYIECLEGFDVINPELAANMNLHMKHVREGSEKYEDVRELMMQSVVAMVDQVKHMSAFSEKISHPCPVCDSELENSKFRIDCTNPDCEFSVPKKLAGVVLTKGVVNDILTKGRSSKVCGFTAKSGKKFDAFLVVENGKLQFNFDSDCHYICPMCKRPMKELNWGYSCTGYASQECAFSIGKVVAGKTLSENVIKSILETGASPLVKGFKSKAGKNFDAKLVLNKQTGKLVFEFLNKK